MDLQQRSRFVALGHQEPGGLGNRGDRRNPPRAVRQAPAQSRPSLRHPSPHTGHGQPVPVSGPPARAARSTHSAGASSVLSLRGFRAGTTRCVIRLPLVAATVEARNRRSGTIRDGRSLPRRRRGGAAHSRCGKWPPIQSRASAPVHEDCLLITRPLTSTNPQSKEMECTV